MRLADQITVTIGGEAVTLRPALACAIRLERAPGGFHRLLREIQDGSLTAACEIIAPHHRSPSLVEQVFAAGVNALTEPLTRYVFACAGIDPDAAQEQPKGKSVSFGEHLQSLYRIGTGWLGWPPQTTLDATPLEIMEAYKGRLDLLKSIFGGAEEDEPDARTLDDKFRAVFASFGTTVIRKGAST